MFRKTSLKSLLFAVMTFSVLFTAGCPSSKKISDEPTVNPSQVSVPVFSPTVGTYSVDQSVGITTATADATIYYTTDGSTPTTLSGVSLPISVAGNGTSMTIKTFAVKAGMIDSAVSTGVFTINYAAPQMTGISCTIDGGASGGPGSLTSPSNMACTITSDINMSSLTLYLRERIAVTEYGDIPITSPNTQNTVINANVTTNPSGTWVYPKIKMCNGASCNTYEYNAADEPAPYVYYLGGSPTTITLIFY
jgi:hypothetical protein